MSDNENVCVVSEGHELDAERPKYVEMRKERECETLRMESMLERIFREMSEMRKENVERFDVMEKGLKEKIREERKRMNDDSRENAKRFSEMVEQKLNDMDEKIEKIHEQIEEKLCAAHQIWEIRHNQVNEQINAAIGGMNELLSRVNSVVEQSECVSVKVSECERRMEVVEEDQRELIEKFVKLDTTCKHELDKTERKIVAVEGEVDRVDEKLALFEKKILLDIGRKINKGNGCTKEISFEEECRKRDLKFQNYREQDPIKFIKHLGQVKREIECEWERTSYGLSKILCGEAGCWYSLVQRQIENFEQFETMFKGKFCDDGYRNYVMDLLTGNYLRFSYVSPTEYLVNLANRVIELEMFSEKALSQRLSRHFGNKIYLLCISRRSESLSEIIEIVSMVDKQTILQDMRVQPEISLGNIELFGSQPMGYKNNVNNYKSTARNSDQGIPYNNDQNFRGKPNGNGPYRGQQFSQPREGIHNQDNNRDGIANGQNKSRPWGPNAADQGENKKLHQGGKWPRQNDIKPYEAHYRVQCAQKNSEDEQNLQTAAELVGHKERDSEHYYNREL